MRSVRPTVGFGPGSGFPLPSKLRDADVIRVAGSHLARFQQPRNLAALISLYEANYRRLVRLVPDLDHLEGSVVSRVAGTLDLYLGVLERRPYTTTLGLTYRFDTSSGLVLDPNARVCVYHDVRAVELLGCCRRSHGPGPPPIRARRIPEIDRKWNTNLFLLKWLKFCIHQGHLFLDCTTREAVDVFPPLLDSVSSDCKT